MNPTLQFAYSERSKIFDALSGSSPWHRLYREQTEIRIQTALHTLAARPLRILDAGGGTGLTAQWLASMGHQVVLADAVPAMLDFAREKARQHPFEIYLADVTDLNFLEASSFDAVICTQVLNFCPDPGIVFKGFQRLLRCPGIVVADIDTAVRWCLLEALEGHLGNALAIIQEGRDRDRNIVGADYYFYARHELFGMIESAGLRVDSSWGNSYVAPYIHLFARSKDFLSPEHLPPQARFFAHEENYAGLQRVEAELAKLNLPDDMAGYLQFVCSKIEPVCG
jgi:ubiquinone/menaquinone biosynthesis C-methylase UbiE